MSRFRGRLTLRWSGLEPSPESVGAVAAAWAQRGTARRLKSDSAQNSKDVARQASARRNVSSRGGAELCDECDVGWDTEFSVQDLS